MKMALQNIFLLSNRSALNLKEAIKLLKKPNLNNDDVVQCYNLEPKSGLWYMCGYNQSSADSIEWQSTGTRSLPNEKNPTVLVEYFSSEKVNKSVFRLTKKNEYDAALVNYSDVNPTFEKLKRTRISKKKSIKNIMKSRFRLIKKYSNSVSIVSDELIGHEPAEKHVSNNFGPYLGYDGSLPGGSTFVQSTVHIVESAPSAPILSQFKDLNISPIIDSKYIQSPNKDFIPKKDADIMIEHVITPITLSSKVTEWSNEVNDSNASEHSLSIHTIDDSLSSINTNKSNTQMLTGRRIVNMSDIIEQIKKRHSGPYGCSFIDTEYESEVNYGFLSVFTFKCKMCNIKTRLHSEYIHNSEMNINNAAVNACQAIGIGHTQLAELSGFLDLPALSSTGFLRVQTEVAEIVHATAWDEMKKAGEEERRLAIESGNLDVDGIPIITVVADGQWSKRSYKTKYDALSGAASIIGYRTQKVLFVGIRNKYCIICQKSSSMKDKEKPVHTCFLNWKKASTCMEADGVLQGFSNSVEMHGLKYNCLIGKLSATFEF
ncbi:uncharacterized protein LOC132936536 [Metopolophium dirhodum]|uniref:uncharacterized protein LOC132936536 n=1 Tax=Metopolophium dirhodum TaxID=44670 RepID=UPI0029900201|nr:uncharacterized protein LOC132936536 [Metopolophium dirhodum]